MNAALPRSAGVSARLHDRLQGTWYGGPARGRWLQTLAWLFGEVVRARRALYRCHLLGSYRSSRPVIVVGNLAVGGTGKTPFVIWLARQLEARGHRVGVASRGYRGAGGPARRVTRNDTAATAGDEPLLLFQRLGSPVAIGARRSRAVRLLGTPRAWPVVRLLQHGERRVRRAVGPMISAPSLRAIVCPGCGRLILAGRCGPSPTRCAPCRRYKVLPERAAGRAA